VRAEISSGDRRSKADADVCSTRSDLQPFDCRIRAQLEAIRAFPSRDAPISAALPGGPGRTTSASPPRGESICKKLLLFSSTWKCRRFKSVGNRFNQHDGLVMPLQPCMTASALFQGMLWREGC